MNPNWGASVYVLGSKALQKAADSVFCSFEKIGINWLSKFEID